MAVKRNRQRFLPQRFVRGEVVDGEGAAARSRVGDDQCRDVARVQGIGAGGRQRAQHAREVAAARTCAPSASGSPPGRNSARGTRILRQEFGPFAGVVGQGAVHGKARLGQRQRRLHERAERARAVAFGEIGQCAHHARGRCREHARTQRLGRHAGRGRARRAARAVQPVDAPRAWIVDQREEIAAQRAGVRAHDAEHERRAHRGVDGVAARAQDVERGIGRQRVTARYDAVRSGSRLRPALRVSRRWRHRFVPNARRIPTAGPTRPSL